MIIFFSPVDISVYFFESDVLNPTSPEVLHLSEYTGVPTYETKKCRKFPKKVS